MKDAILRIYLDVGTTACLTGHAEIADGMFKAAIDEAQRAGQANGTLLQVLLRISVEYLGAGRFNRALGVSKKALIIYDHALGRDNEHSVVVLDQMASVYLTQGKLGMAELYYKRAQKAESAIKVTSAQNLKRQIARLRHLCGVLAARGKAQEAHTNYAIVQQLEQALSKTKSDRRSAINAKHETINRRHITDNVATLPQQALQLVPLVPNLPQVQNVPTVQNLQNVPKITQTLSIIWNNANRFPTAPA